MAEQKRKGAAGLGSVQWKRGHLQVRVSLPDGTRPWYRLCGSQCTCREMSEAMIAERASSISGRERARVAAELGENAQLRGPRTTMRDFGEAWTKGELHRKWPGHVKQKRTAHSDRERLEKHVYPIVETVFVSDFRLDDAERVMARLPKDLSSASRRHVSQLLHRLMILAVYPARLRTSNPLPRGFMPKIQNRKADQWLYPEEEARLLACTEVDLGERMYFGFLAREGMREGEALALEWKEVDLRYGVVRLDANKTDEPRAWKLGPDVRRALESWWLLVGSPKGGRVFQRRDDGSKLNRNHMAKRLRAYLQKAKVTRPELFEKSKARLRFRVHDLRATFATLALADGRTETWVTDRTGWKSSTMVAKYRRTARTAGELELGWLKPLDASVPELAALANVRALHG